MGTENFSNIENVTRKDAQILSYPGLKLDHLVKMLYDFKYGKSCANPGLKPTHLVMMVGLNDMELARMTNKQNISKIHSAAKLAFPGTKVSFCQVPMKKNLFQPELVTRIDELNEDIATYCNRHELNCIPRINKEDFEVQENLIRHWTPPCGDKTIQHIFDHLN